MSFKFNAIGLAKQIVRLLLGESILGFIDYVRFPDRGNGIGGPFNGQPARQALFLDLVGKLNPAAIVETGTHRGATTNFMAQTGLPIFTIELDPRNWGYARARFWRSHNVTVVRGDSRAGLNELLRGPMRHKTTSTLLFYLDAHWNDDLPLAEEINIIFARCRFSVVIIDDFQVPFDDGYGYDDYGPGKSLVYSYIAPVVLTHTLRVFYPSTPSAEDWGWRRGCIVLATQESHVEALASMPLLRSPADEFTNCFAYRA